MTSTAGSLGRSVNPKARRQSSNATVIAFSCSGENELCSIIHAPAHTTITGRQSALLQGKIAAVVHARVEPKLFSLKPVARKTPLRSRRSLNLFPAEPSSALARHSWAEPSRSHSMSHDPASFLHVGKAHSRTRGVQAKQVLTGEWCGPASSAGCNVDRMTCGARSWAALSHRTHGKLGVLRQAKRLGRN